METVVIPYAPRDVFKPFHNRKERWACVVAHRRAGKTVACINDLIRSALTLPNKPTCIYVAPYHAQAKDIAWNYIKEFAGVIPGVTFNESELRANLPNGGIVRLYGGENYHRLRGLSLAEVVLDEYADMDPRVWGEVIRPALADRQGRAVFIGTPKGHNGFHTIYQQAKSSNEWFCAELRASETGILPKSELDDAAKGMTEDQYAQEFECSFEAAILGAYYGKDIEAARKNGRIGRVPWEPMLPVYTAWDLGIDDATAIWCVQVSKAGEYRVIDYYEASGEGLGHYVNWLRSKPYTWAKHYLPHDAAVKELGTGKSRIEVLEGFGVKAELGKAQSVEDGINAVRLLLPKCWFDEQNCARGIEALTQYRTEYDQKNKVFRRNPLHDWTSHAADAFRYFAMNIKADKPKEWAKPKVDWIV